MKRILYWLDTHTIHPLAWPYVIFRTIQYNLEGIFWPRKTQEDSITSTGTVCPACGHTDFTEQGLCERCGNIVF